MNSRLNYKTGTTGKRKSGLNIWDQEFPQKTAEKVKGIQVFEGQESWRTDPNSFNSELLDVLEETN